jgi:hypothetical protein
MSVITLGAWDRAKRDLDIDKMFHLYMGVRLLEEDDQTPMDGQTVVEKNQVINVGPLEEREYRDAMTLRYRPRITLANFINNGFGSLQDSGLNPFAYDGANNNCQIFLAHMLRANAMTGDGTAMEFILQNTQYLIDQINPLTQNIMRGAISAAQFVENLLD